jgi:3'-5' exoribonuclease
MKIKDIKVGDSYNMIAVVTDSNIRVTKTGKNFLDMEVFDGEQTINGKIWDYGTKVAVPKNTVVNLVGTMSEYLGAKQLAITTCNYNTDTPLASFAPVCQYNVDEYLQMARDLLSKILPKSLRELTTKIFLDHTKMFMVVPGAKKIHHAYIAGTLVHSVDTARKAIAISNTCEHSHVGLCIAGALLHDIGKLYTYSLNGVTIDYTEGGESLDHIALGLICLNDYKTTDNINLIALLQHIVASHHGKLEYGSPVTPNFLEAWIVHFADGIDSKVETIRILNSKTLEGNIYTDKEWTMDNRRMITYRRIIELLGE